MKQKESEKRKARHFQDEERKKKNINMSSP
jgi:hypothetical protein